LAATDEKSLVSQILSNFNNKQDLWEKYSKTVWKNNWWSKEMIFVTNFLRKHNEQNFSCVEYTDKLFRQYVSDDIFSFSDDLYLSQRHVEEISNDDNFVIGGHGYSSNSLLLEKNYKHDISESTKTIKKYTDYLCFSYPHGGYSDEIKESLIENKYQLSYTVNQFTITELDTIDMFEFPRYDGPQSKLL
jgi:hypothetical protein